MLTGLASTHLDYVIFIGGAGMAVVAVHAVGLLIAGNRKAPWGWLAPAGAMVALADWVWILVYGLSGQVVTANAQLLLGGAGVLCLIVFVSRGVRGTRDARAGRWLLASAIAAMVAGFALGGRMATLGVVGVGAGACWWAAYFVFKLGRGEGPPQGRPLIGLAVGFAVYGAAALFTVPAAQLVAEIVGAAQPGVTVGGLAQLARTAASILMALSLDGYVLELGRLDADDRVRNFVLPAGVGLLMFLIATIVVGWGITAEMTSLGERQVQRDLIQRTRTAAGSLHTQDVEDLVVALRAGDAHAEVGQRSGAVVPVLDGIRRENPDLVGIHLIANTDEGVVVAADSAAHGLAASPGAACPYTTAGLVSDLLAGHTRYEGPVAGRDGAGARYTAFVPVRDPRTGHSLALLAVDRDAAEVSAEIVAWRLRGVMVALLSTGMVLGLYLAFHTTIAWARRITFSEKGFRAIFEDAPEAILQVDPDSFRILSANEAAARWLGYDRDDLSTLSLIDLAGGARGAAWTFAAAAAEAGLDSPARGRFLKADGTVVDVEMTATSMHKDARERLLMFCRDVTVKRRAEEAMVEARTAAESANRAKSTFLATMSHEIRTPMNAVIGMDELLLETELTADQERYVRIGLAAGEQLLELINDVLDLSKIEADKLELEEIDFDVRALARQVMDVAGVRAHAKGLELSAAVDDDVPAALVGDLGRLRQVLTNLVGNAVKFTERGEVAVRVAKEIANGDGLSRFRFEVRDTGVGIAEDKLAEIFEAFSQADTSTTRTHGGTGLGLAISKRIVETAGGRLWAESRRGEGSTFTFVVPLGVAAVSSVGAPEPSGAPADDAEAPEPGGTPEPPESSLRILLAEDCQDNRFLMEAYFAGTPHLLEVAVDGESAVERFLAAGPGAYDLVLMDMQMPKKDGYAATREIREWELANGVARTPIVALTAYSLNVETQKSLDAGCDGHLIKPIRKAVLLAALSRYARPRETVAGA